MATAANKQMRVKELLFVGLVIGGDRIEVKGSQNPHPETLRDAALGGSQAHENHG